MEQGARERATHRSALALKLKEQLRFCRRCRAATSRVQARGELDAVSDAPRFPLGSAELKVDAEGREHLPKRSHCGGSRLGTSQHSDGAVEMKRPPRELDRPSVRRECSELGLRDRGYQSRA